MEILSTRFGESMIFTVFAMAKAEISSTKTCMITIPPPPLKSTIDDQISEMLSLSCTAMDLMDHTVRTVERIVLRSFGIVCGDGLPYIW